MRSVLLRLCTNSSCLWVCVQACCNQHIPDRNAWNNLPTKINAAARKLLDALGLDFINQKMNAEMRKLIEIARVMYTKPEVLIADETTTVFVS